MPKALAPGELYAHRRPDSTIFQVDIDREAADLLRRYAGPGRTLGRFVARLVYEHHARQEERARLTGVVQQALAGVTAGRDADDDARPA